MKLILLEFYKNNMCLKSYILIFLIATFSMQGQNANSSASKSIKANFTIASVKAYQESATLKVEDFYNYLSLFSAESTSESLKSEIKSSIYNLFEDENCYVIDYISIEKNPISLKDLLLKIENKNYLFTVSDFESSIVAKDFWTTQYLLTLSQNETPTEIVLYQKIGFKPIIKTFGSSKKEVWTLFLSEVSLP